jgi:uncharacterized protein (DUF1800 family)
MKKTPTSYSGPWTRVQAAHLLRRTTFGITQERIDTVIDMGMEAAVEFLLRDIPLPNPPLNRFDNEDLTPIGESWIHQPFSRNSKRQQSFNAWTIDLMMNEGINIREKLTLFWHNHFVVADVKDARMVYTYSNTLRSNALGNFADFVKAITIDPGMLRYLNGRDNKASAPNENYARELLELFTVGKGDVSGPGDYTSFTEDDVHSIARILTGWRDINYKQDDPIGVEYKSSRHDKESKVLSHRFGNQVIGNEEEEEYAHLIDILMQSPFVAKHICKKLFLYFVHYNISEEVEENLLEPLANVFRENNYEIKPVLYHLFTSEEFYKECWLGSMIRNPLDFILHTVISMPNRLGRRADDIYKTQYGFFDLSASLQMELYNHPDVAGWKPYYQGPNYYQLWINSVTLPIRVRITDELLEGDDQFLTGVNILSFIDNMPNPYDINELIADIGALLFPRPLKPDQIETLKELVIPGLPDFEWTVEYTAYRNDLENFPLLWSIRLKIKDLLLGMLRMPEYYLS